MPAGFLYVLINPTMPGLAKVGKTTRNPTDRVSELSSATGVPSPFMLAFQQPVADCNSAELWVHKELERKGFRHADNREFFNAPLHDIIKIVAEAANLVFDTPNLNDSGVESSAHESSAEVLSDELYNLGVTHSEGTDTVLRNQKKALEYFEQAAALGNAHACVDAARYYEDENGVVHQDLEKALGLYGKAVHLGHWWREADIADIFLAAKQEAAAQKHWKLFFERAFEENSDGPNEFLLGQNIGFFGHFGARYCELVATGKLAHCVSDQTIVRLAKPLLVGINEKVLNLARYPDKELAQFANVRLNKARCFVEAKQLTAWEKNSPTHFVPPTPKWSFRNFFK